MGVVIVEVEGTVLRMNLGRHCNQWKLCCARERRALPRLLRGGLVIICTDNLCADVAACVNKVTSADVTVS